ncbi:T9SS type A sorting domain-containing protein [Lewinella sp. 4G2]|uniref:T9SS type A sorting domain-containing protein n=1 Tax=Lewinella sp. 4G2 TaxID=1803372 RepID=UPI0007B4E1B4|nr:T9SS type A sorting domain-containing protein [Lewinella sp. 4G2]OAV43906.1 hypothetical protein A3850_005095 [Lewinella sp. 4G2]
MTLQPLSTYLATTLLLLSCVTQVSAQDVTIFAQDGTFSANDTIKVDIVTIGLDSMVSGEFSLGWDTLLLEFQGIDNVDEEIQDHLNPVFNRTQVDSGRVGFQIIDFGLQNLTSRDTVVIFSAVFTSLVNSNATTTIGIIDQPLPTLFGLLDQSQANTTKLSGTITLEQSTSLQNLGLDQRLTVSPNPITSESVLEIELSYASRANLEIIDMSGKLCRKESVQLSVGDNRIPLQVESMITAGTYLLRLTTDREQLVRKIVR